MTETAALHWGNPSGLNAFSVHARRMIEAARQQISAFFSFHQQSISFTSGATEANNAVLRAHLDRGHRLVASAGDHPSLIAQYEQLAPHLLSIIPVGADGRWQLDLVEYELKKAPCLIACAWANGETGVLQDIAAISALARQHDAALLIDAAQAFGRFTDYTDLAGANYISLSGHKLHAPKGVGALIQTGRLPLVQLQYGGNQEQGLRGGTENFLGITAFGKAAELRQGQQQAAVQQLCDLRNLFEHRLTAALPAIVVHGAAAPRVCNTSNIAFTGVDGMALQARLEDRGIICSQVSACSSASPSPSKALTAMGISSTEAFSSLRFGFSVLNTTDQIRQATEIISEEVAFLREIMGDLM